MELYFGIMFGGIHIIIGIGIISWQNPDGHGGRALKVHRRCIKCNVQPRVVHESNNIRITNRITTLSEYRRESLIIGRSQWTLIGTPRGGFPHSLDLSSLIG